jgi:hypothetical protein
MSAAFAQSVFGGRSRSSIVENTVCSGRVEGFVRKDSKS